MSRYNNSIVKRSPVFFRICLLIALLASGLVACEPAPAAPTGSLVVAVPSGTIASAAEAYTAWFEQQTGQHAVLERLGSDLYADQIHAALLSGSDRYDLVYLPADSLAKWAGYHTLQPLQPLPDPQALAPWLWAVSVDAQVFGVPVQPDAMVVWYRADLLQSAGLQPPADWDAFLAAARALNRPPDRYGAVIAGSDVDAASTFSAVLAGFGGQAVNDQYQSAINDATALRALTWYAGLRSVDHVTPPGVENYTAFDVVSSLEKGKAVLGIAPLSAGDTLLDCENNARLCDADGKPLLAFTRLPGLPPASAIGSLGALAIPIHALHAGSAQAFATRLATAEGAIAWAAGGGTPANRAALNDTRVKDKLRGAEYLGNLEQYHLPIPPLSTGEQVQKAYHQAVHEAVAGSQAPGQALSTAAAEMKKALRQGGY